jgi:hypothetical protein
MITFTFSKDLGKKSVGITKVNDFSVLRFNLEP